MEFKLFGFEVEIRWSFWLMTAFLGMRGSFSDPEAIRRMLLWIPAVLVSILIHELGHAVAIRTRGIQPSISLHWMGGTTSWRETLPISRPWQVIVSLAGPFAGFVFAGVVYLTQLLLQSRGVGLGEIAQITFSNLLWINLFWGMVNLLPVLPFDGGHVLESALGPRRIRITLIISTIVGVLATLAMLKMGMMLGAMFFGSGALQTLFQLQAIWSSRPEPRATNQEIPAEEQKVLVEAQAFLDEGDYDRALQRVEQLTPAGGEKAASPQAFLRALSIVAWANALSGRHERAEQAAALLDRLGSKDLGLLGFISFQRQDMPAASQLLQSAIDAGDTRRNVVGAMIQAKLASSDFDGAALVAERFFESLSSDDLRRISEIGIAGGASTGPARLLEKVFEREGEKEDAYLAARSAARAGTVTKAKDLLERAVRAGFSDRDRALAESDLQPLRITGFIESLFAKANGDPR